MLASSPLLAVFEETIITGSVSPATDTVKQRAKNSDKNTETNFLIIINHL